MEAGWGLGKTLDFDNHLISISSLPQERLDKYNEFHNIITEANRLGNLKFRANEYDLPMNWITEEELEDSEFMRNYHQYQYYLNITILDAMKFAREKHGDQKRKYSNASYYREHCIEVYSIIDKLNGASGNMKIAALLHDTVEDTDTKIEDIAHRFGVRVAEIVAGLTDVSRPTDGNRKLRKKMDLDHLAMQDAETKSVKLADLISNSKSIFGYARFDPAAKAFAKLYAEEKAALLEVLTEGGFELHEQATQLLKDYLFWRADQLANTGGSL